MKETITIKNFGGLKDVTLPLNSINIFIGKQAAGKSVTAKLIYFFKNSFEVIFDRLTEDKNREEIEQELIERFKKYFPPESWSKEKFSIKYNPSDAFVIGENKAKSNVSLGSIIITRKSKDEIKINCSRVINEMLAAKSAILNEIAEGKETPFVISFNAEPIKTAKVIYRLMSQSIKAFGFQMFIPAGRSFFSNIQNSIFSIMNSNNSIDPFLLEFGSFYEKFKNYQSPIQSETTKDYLHNSFADVLDAEFFSDKTGDYLIHRDGRKINLLFCSSGQQEVLPLAIILKNLVAVLNSFDAGSNTIYIEEPEAHLFPSAQKKVVEILATLHNVAENKSQLIITTHSPYILTSFNNLLQAGQLLEGGANKKKLFKIVPEFEILKPGELNAYAFADGGVMSLIDEETGLISADLLDEVSEEIAVEFDELLNL